MYTGRFAPSPTGPLHFGSLVAALASYMVARRAKGKWLVRMEDLDRPREQPGAADAILRALEVLGLHWDGAVEYQSRRAALYDDALARLRPCTYPCGCTRSEIADSALAIDGARVYGGACRGGLLAGKTARAVRIKARGDIGFTDRLQGPQSQRLERDVGDFVLWRADGLHAYQLAVVVDDAAQGVTDVVRGADLLDSTARQIFLQQRLGLPTPGYLHVPVAVNAAGQKLSKQTGAEALDLARPGEALRRALVFLGQEATGDLAEGLRNWNPSRIPRTKVAH